MADPRTVTRFAPSPTGGLHLGSAYAALFAEARARQDGGRFLLRLEDIDAARCRPGYAAAILEDLRWLGVAWDGEVRVQSQHLPEYAASLDRLSDMGLLYPCFCTRADLALSAPHGPEGPLYPGTCRHLPKALAAERIARGERYALRMDVAEAARRAGPLGWHEEAEGWIACDPCALGDAVLARKDVPASYHLCVTHDDAVQGVTVVTRAADLRPVTGLHRLLQSLLGWPEPRYAHHALLHGTEGRRLAKRDKATSLRDLRAEGATPDAVRGAIAALLPAGDL